MIAREAGADRALRRGAAPGWRWAARALLAAAAIAMAVYTVGPRPGLLAWDKAEHFCGALGLMLLTAASFPRAPLWPIAILLCALIGLSEAAQAALPARSASLKDTLAGLAGVATALAAFGVARLRTHENKWRTRQDSNL